MSFMSGTKWQGVHGRRRSSQSPRFILLPLIVHRMQLLLLICSCSRVQSLMSTRCEKSTSRLSHHHLLLLLLSLLGMQISCKSCSCCHSISPSSSRRHSVCQCTRATGEDSRFKSHRITRPEGGGVSASNHSLGRRSSADNASCVVWLRV